MDLHQIVLKKTMPLWTRERYLKITVKIFTETNMKSSLKYLPAVNVWCKLSKIQEYKYLSETLFRYTCNKFDDFTGGILLMWNTSVSDRCCQSCDGVVYKADSVIATIDHEDECQTVETSVCRILPGEGTEKKFLLSNFFFLRSRQSCH